MLDVSGMLSPHECNLSIGIVGGTPQGFMKKNLVLEQLGNLLPTNECKRLFHGRGGLVEGWQQINIELYGPVLWVMVYQEIDETELLACLNDVKGSVGQWDIEHIYIQRRHIRGNPVEIYYGNDSYLRIDFKVREADLEYWVNLGRNQNTGLFLDMSNGRQWLRENSQGKSVLNLCAYTCSLGVSAAKGGASAVCNIDMAKAVIKRGQQNFALNNLSGRNTFIAQDIFKMIKKLNQKGPYDILVADPPSFQAKGFDVKKDYAKMLNKLRPSLADDAILMLCLNSPLIGLDFIHDLVAQEIPEAVFIQRLENPVVLADKDEDSSLKVVLYQMK